VTWEKRIQHVALTDVGLRRSNNQDNYAVMLAPNQESWQAQGHLFVVADGMGAHAAGELASKLAADTIPHTYSKLRGKSVSQAIRTAVKEANHEIHSRGQTYAEFRGMGTTSSVLVLLPQGALVGHVGDSRIYRLRSNGLFEQLTFDHSLVWELRARGQLKMLGDSTNVPKNIITRSLGPSAEVEVDLEGPFPLQLGDTFLLCSDGLSGQVEDQELAAILHCMSPEDAGQLLIDLSNLRGGPDNITLIIVRVLAPMGIATGAALSDLGLIEKESSPRSLAWLGWVAAGLLAVGGVGLAMVQNWSLAIVMLVVAGVAALLTWQFSPRTPVKEGSPSTTGRLGRAPYRRCQVALDQEFTDKLKQTCDELRQAGQKESWAVNWAKFTSLCDAAAKSLQQQNPSECVRDYGHAISFMMSELRNLKNKTPS